MKVSAQNKKNTLWNLSPGWMDVKKVQQSKLKPMAPPEEP